VVTMKQANPESNTYGVNKVMRTRVHRTKYHVDFLVSPTVPVRTLEAKGVFSLFWVM
jgi:hypothetical protein